MYLTGKATEPGERTTLTTGMLAYLVESHHRGDVRLETPDLDIAYQPPERPGAGRRSCGSGRHASRGGRSRLAAGTGRRLHAAQPGCTLAPGILARAPLLVARCSVRSTMPLLLLQDHAYLPTYGGGIKANRLLMEVLARRGHACTAIRPR